MTVHLFIKVANHLLWINESSWEFLNLFSLAISYGFADPCTFPLRDIAVLLITWRCALAPNLVLKSFPLFHTDINECIEYEDYENPYTTNDVQVEHNHLCHAKATCFNTIGSFHCKCKLGYHGDGKLCLSNKYRMVAALFRSKWQRAKGVCGKC